MANIDGIAERIPLDEFALLLPICVIGRAEQDAHAEIDVDQFVGNQFSVDHDTRGDVHLLAPAVHVLVFEIRFAFVIQRTPAP
jgi:hypothetical protein